MPPKLLVLLFERQVTVHLRAVEGSDGSARMGVLRRPDPETITAPPSADLLAG